MDYIHWMHNITYILYAVLYHIYPTTATVQHWITFPISCRVRALFFLLRRFYFFLFSICALDMTTIYSFYMYRIALFMGFQVAHRLHLRTFTFFFLALAELCAAVCIFFYIFFFCWKKNYGVVSLSNLRIYMHLFLAFRLFSLCIASSRNTCDNCVRASHTPIITGILQTTTCRKLIFKVKIIRVNHSHAGFSLTTIYYVSRTYAGYTASLFFYSNFDPRPDNAKTTHSTSLALSNRKNGNKLNFKPIYNAKYEWLHAWIIFYTFFFSRKKRISGRKERDNFLEGFEVIMQWFLKF